PLVYLIQTPGVFRVLGLGGLAAFSALSLWQAAVHGWVFLLIGAVIAVALWCETSLDVCRRCRHLGSWHCLGQGKAVASLFRPNLFRQPPAGLGRSGIRLHLALAAIYIIYGLFWLWHFWPIGLIFTLWVPIAALSSIPADGFSWKRTRVQKFAA
ncbi:MAG: hypothetical protein ACREP6_10885, partial [Candidatus Binataceae bacterium]